MRPKGRLEVLFPVDISQRLLPEKISYMSTRNPVSPWWAALTVWGVVNAVNLLQAAGFLSRIPTGSRELNHLLGYAMILLALPVAAALAAFVRSGAGWRHRIGPAAYLLFITFMLFVDYLRPVEFRTPPNPTILVPYLALFFGSIFLMGFPMLRLNLGLWYATLVSTIFLLGSMILAMIWGVA